MMTVSNIIPRGGDWRLYQQSNDGNGKDKCSKIALPHRRRIPSVNAQLSSMEVSIRQPDDTSLVRAPSLGIV